MADVRYELGICKEIRKRGKEYLPSLPRISEFSKNNLFWTKKKNGFRTSNGWKMKADTGPVTWKLNVQDISEQAIWIRLSLLF